MPKVKVAIRSKVKILSQQFPKNCWSKFKELHRKKEHNEKVCRAQELGSYAQGQGHNQVKGQIVPKIVLPIIYWSKFDETSQKDKA